MKLNYNGVDIRKMGIFTYRNMYGIRLEKEMILYDMGRNFKKRSISMESNLLSPLDRRVYQCIKSEGDKITQSNIIKKSLSQTLGATIEEIDEEGNVMAVSIAQKIVNATIQDAIENPDTRKLRDLANISGELKEGNSSINMNFNNPANLFQGLAFEEEVIEADYKEV